MEDLQHFCLRWNNYRNNITTAFENLRDDEDFIDVTLACDGKTLKAHRVVLSACSPYFRELLKSTPCKHPVIVLQDVVFDDLHALVEFIYHGEVNVHQRNLTSFLKTAEVLKVSGLTQQNAAVTATTLPSSAPPILDHYNENLSTRFPTRSPGTPSEKMNQFQQHFLYNTNQSQISLVNDENRLAQLQTIRHRRHLRSLTPIRCSQSQDDSPISPKRTKSAENALQSPLSNCSNIFSLSPSTISNDESTSRCKNSSETLSSSHRSSPNEIVSPTIANTNKNTNNSVSISTTTVTTTTSSSLPSSSPCSSSATTVEIPVNTATTSKANSPIKYDENHNSYKDNNHSNCEQDIDKDEEEEPPVDFSITSSDNYVKKYNHPENIHRTTSNSSPSPKNLSLKCEPKDEAFGNNSSAAANDHDNFNDDDSNLSEDRLSDQSPPSNVPYPQALLDAEDAFQGHPGYLASLRFNMAAAALAGFNHHQSHTAVTANAVLDGLTAPSQGLKKVFPCLACGKVLCSKASLKRHVADKHASHQEEYRCAICERVYCSRNSLMTHIYTYHKTRPTLLMPPPHHASTPNSHATDIKF